ncbi:hypothetical protein BC826DRAFT_1038439 [Russula brevipes]|nr:hypothetical protein BC826DRAFT_1038439 [Russula brevipes]
MGAGTLLNGLSFALVPVLPLSLTSYSLPPTVSIFCNDPASPISLLAYTSSICPLPAHRIIFLRHSPHCAHTPQRLESFSR